MTEPTRADAIRAIAYLAAVVRPDWDRPGIEAALQRIDPTIDVAAMTHAAMTCAELRRDQRTPAVIATPGPHWAPFPSPAAHEPDRRNHARRREEAEWAHTPKPTPQRIKDLRHLSRHGITPTAPEAAAWLAANPTPTQPRDTRRPPVLALQHNNHDNTVTITVTVARRRRRHLPGTDPQHRARIHGSRKTRSMTSTHSFIIGFIILTAGIAAVAVTFGVFMLTNGRAVRTAEYGYRIGRFLVAFAVGWLLVTAGFATATAVIH